MNDGGIRNRRSFLKTIATSGAAVAMIGSYQSVTGQTLKKWKSQIGLELYTVRDLLAKDFEGTIAKVAEIGYKEVEPVGYGGLDPKQFRALLDRYKLTAPSTHAGATEGPDLEKELEGHQIMGFKYTEIHSAKVAGTPSQRPAKTIENIKRSAQQYNRQGALAKKFGMKVLVHNHAGEFDRLEDRDRTQYDVLLAETDPSVVALQLDIGWCTLAGQDAVQMFRKHPGRFELWHVKDEIGLKQIAPDTPPGKRRATFVPVGQGEIDYKTIFANAELAGMKHYVIEQDNAAEHGADSIAAARASFEGLTRILG
jgi:sugar phosphate isomerase/epimerase